MSSWPDASFRVGALGLPRKVSDSESVVSRREMWKDRAMANASLHEGTFSFAYKVSLKV
jgi:hypothetical protein